MPLNSSYKARRNETKYPYIAELPASMRGLDVALSAGFFNFLGHGTFSRDTDAQF